ncbi:MAG: nucleotidyltransferase family protein [Candidatus Aminicenantes bacterium]|nr:nucleotidyltransferase family protein [Candidatus Aminicenantes bacterium]
MKDFSTKNRLQALILAGGRGKRLNEYTHEINKCMIDFNGKPLIEHSLENAIKLNVSQIVIVVGYLAEQIIKHYGNAFSMTPIKYVIQKEQHGLVHAIACAKSMLADSDFILMLGDEFFIEPNHQQMFDFFIKENAFSVCGVIRVDQLKLISKTYSILTDKDSKQIFRLIEKPANPTNNFMGTGNIFFKNKILVYIEKTPVSPQRGERELPDLIQCAVDDNQKVCYYVLASRYVNVNTPDDTVLIKSLAQE